MAEDPRGGEVEVSPEEERFLKRFFRRQALPWFGAAVVIAVTAATGLQDDGDDAALEARTSAAFAQLRAENEQLSDELKVLAGRVGKRPQQASTQTADELERRVEAARRNVSAIEARITAELDRRLDSLEARQGQAPAAASAEGLPNGVSAWDVSAILERLYALEMQQGGSPGSASAGSGDSARIAELERRLERVEDAPASLPAAATP